MWATTTVVKTGDFNGDGKSDILWCDSAGNTSIWLMNGATVAQTGPFVQIPNNWSIADTGDFNGDGSSDILWNDTSGNVQIWFMRGVAAKLRECSSKCRPAGRSKPSTPTEFGLAWIESLAHPGK